MAIAFHGYVHWSENSKWRLSIAGEGRVLRRVGILLTLVHDDTSLIFKTDRSKDNSDDVSHPMSHVSHWFTANNLVLNAKKTKCVEFMLPNVKKVDKRVMLNGESLEMENSTVFLGVTLVCKPQWGANIETQLSGRVRDRDNDLFLRKEATTWPAAAPAHVPLIYTYAAPPALRQDLCYCFLMPTHFGHI
ncbi:jg24466 [Pararge aegeria aegeria]|uniref:Jg24466 protein n=1 Tax=Pararge aegeria aegeria TaxID=348720 RepID=A0A8S4RJY8_9NEOP|nr:jg24466 [Pararge aegeria aegeria]